LFNLILIFNILFFQTFKDFFILTHVLKSLHLNFVVSFRTLKHFPSVCSINSMYITQVIAQITSSNKLNNDFKQSIYKLISSE
jgi:hypothetical protein